MLYESAWHDDVVRTEIQSEFGNARWNECAGGDCANCDGRVHVGASVERDGRAPRYLGYGVRGALDVRVEQVGRSRKVDWRRLLRECLIEVVRVPQSCKLHVEKHAYAQKLEADQRVSMSCQ